MGILTTIEPQKQAKRYNIYIDGEFSFGIHENTLIKYNLFSLKGKQLDEPLIEEIILAEEKNKAYQYALLLLSYRARSSSEIKTKMIEKGFSSDIIESTLSKLIELGYLDDMDFAKKFIQHRQVSKKIGKNLIKQELWRKGISRANIDELLKEVSDDQQEYDRAKELASKKISSYRNDEAKVKQRKLYSFLVRKGYSFETAAQVIRDLLDEEVYE